MVLDFLAVDNFDFTRKIVKKNLGEKIVKMLGFCQIEFLDKNLTFRMVWINAILKLIKDLEVCYRYHYGKNLSACY